VNHLTRLSAREDFKEIVPVKSSRHNYTWSFLHACHIQQYVSWTFFTLKIRYMFRYSSTMCRRISFTSNHRRNAFNLLLKVILKQYNVTVFSFIRRHLVITDVKHGYPHKRFFFVPKWSTMLTNTTMIVEVQPTWWLILLVLQWGKCFTECWPKPFSYTTQCLVMKLTEFYIKSHGLHIHFRKKIFLPAPLHY